MRASAALSAAALLTGCASAPLPQLTGGATDRYGPGFEHVITAMPGRARVRLTDSAWVALVRLGIDGAIGIVALDREETERWTPGARWVLLPPIRAYRVAGLPSQAFLDCLERYNRSRRGAEWCAGLAPREVTDHPIGDRLALLVTAEPLATARLVRSLASVPPDERLGHLAALLAGASSRWALYVVDY